MKLDSPGTAAIAQISLQWPYMQIITAIPIKKLPKSIIKTERSWNLKSNSTLFALVNIFTKPSILENSNNANFS